MEGVFLQAGWVQKANSLVDWSLKPIGLQGNAIGTLQKAMQWASSRRQCNGHPLQKAHYLVDWYLKPNGLQGIVIGTLQPALSWHNTGDMTQHDNRTQQPALRWHPTA